MQGAKRSRTGDRGYPRTGGQDPGFAKLEMHRKNRGPTQRQKVGEKTGGRKNLMLKDPPASRKIAKGGSATGYSLQVSALGNRLKYKKSQSTSNLDIYKSCFGKNRCRVPRGVAPEIGGTLGPAAKTQDSQN